MRTMRTNTTRRLCIGGVIGALYALLTLALPFASFGPLQIRFSEAMTILPFFLPETIPGLTVGCFIANLVGSPYSVDWLVGTFATLLAAIWTSKMKNKWLAPLPPVICNTIIIGAEVAWVQVGFTDAFPAAFLYNSVTVGVGEFLACYTLGLLLLQALPKVTYFRDLMAPERLKQIS